MRLGELLPRTLRSLKDAGFDKPRLFLDGASNRDAQRWEERFGLEVTARSPRILVHGNWVLAAMELFIRCPEAERYAIFQDDLVTCRNLRAYLEAVEYPDGPINSKMRPGYWNLYTCPANQTLADGRTGFYPSNQFGRGALALVFSRECLITLLSSRHLVERPVDPHRGWRAVDGGIVSALSKAGWIEYVHNPSLVLHTGRVSSFDKGKGNVTAGTAGPGGEHKWPGHYEQTSFRGEDWDARDMLGK